METKVHTSFIAIQPCRLCDVAFQKEEFLRFECVRLGIVLRDLLAQCFDVLRSKKDVVEEVRRYLDSCVRGCNQYSLFFNRWRQRTVLSSSILGIHAVAISRTSRAVLHSGG
jgi:hypothetical protein